MILESTDGLLGSIAVMYMQRPQLVSATNICDGAMKSGTRFVIHDVDGSRLVYRMQAGMESLISGNAMGIHFGGKGLDQDSIAAMECDHDVLVATCSSGSKAPSVIREDA